MTQTDLSKYSKEQYQPGPLMLRSLWYVIGMIFLASAFPWPQGFKKWLLVLFGAKIGTGFVIKPRVRIKYPWFLEMGDYVWLGEDVWIDNLVQVTIEHHVCISQGAYLTTGSHDYKKTSFDLVLKPIHIKEGVWVAAKCVINPGVTIGAHSVIGAGSVVVGDTDEYMIYAGNPAKPIKKRVVE